MNDQLSICIPTYNRRTLLKECLDSFVPQVARYQIPIYVSDNASTDDTIDMLCRYKAERYEHLFYRSNSENLGIDGNVAAVVAMANTRFCWLFGDDDVIVDGAVDAVMAKLAEDVQLIVLNASGNRLPCVEPIVERRLPFIEDRMYEPGQHDALLKDTATQATYIGSLVVDRTRWSRFTDVPYSTYYFHIAVVFSCVVGCRAAVIAKPYIRCRVSQATWADRMFEVLMIRWPEAVWALGPEYATSSKAAVTPRERISSSRHLMAARAMGLYDKHCYHRHVEKRLTGRPATQWMARSIAAIPEWFYRMLFRLYLYASRIPSYRLFLYEMRMREESLKKQRNQARAACRGGG